MMKMRKFAHFLSLLAFFTRHCHTGLLERESRGMALTADQIQARIDALQAARDSGVLIVRHGDTSTQFRSLAELNQTLAD